MKVSRSELRKIITESVAEVFSEGVNEGLFGGYSKRARSKDEKVLADLADQNAYLDQLISDLENATLMKDLLERLNNEILQLRKLRKRLRGRKGAQRQLEAEADRIRTLADKAVQTFPSLAHRLDNIKILANAAARGMDPRIAQGTAKRGVSGEEDPNFTTAMSLAQEGVGLAPERPHSQKYRNMDDSPGAPVVEESGALGGITVAELIQKLSTMPPDSLVVYDDLQTALHPVNIVETHVAVEHGGSLDYAETSGETRGAKRKVVVLSN